MDRIETEALIRATDKLIHEYDADHQFNADDISHMHKVWLGDIYEWAGQYRSATQKGHPLACPSPLHFISREAGSNRSGNC